MFDSGYGCQSKIHFDFLSQFRHGGKSNEAYERRDTSVWVLNILGSIQHGVDFGQVISVTLCNGVLTDPGKYKLLERVKHPQPKYLCVP